MSASAQPDEFEALVRRVPLFSELDRVDLARLIGVLEELRFPAGRTIFREGDEAGSLHILADGTVAVTVRAPEGERLVATLHAPDHFGELGLLLLRRTATAKAVTDVHVWRLPRDRYQRLARENPELVQHPRLRAGVAARAAAGFRRRAVDGGRVGDLRAGAAVGDVRGVYEPDVAGGAQRARCRRGALPLRAAGRRA